MFEAKVIIICLYGLDQWFWTFFGPWTPVLRWKTAQYCIDMLIMWFMIHEQQFRLMLATWCWTQKSWLNVWKKHEIFMYFYCEILQRQQEKGVSVCDIRLKFILSANHSRHRDVENKFSWLL